MELDLFDHSFVLVIDNSITVEIIKPKKEAKSSADYIILKFVTDFEMHP